MVGYNHQNTQAILFCTLKPNQALPKHFLTIVSDSKVWFYFCQNRYMKAYKDNTLDVLWQSPILLFSFSDFMNIKCSPFHCGLLEHTYIWTFFVARIQSAESSLI